MELGNTIDIISSVGFPIALSIGLCWLLFQLFKAYREDIKEQQKQHSEEINTLKDVINQNTLALQQLISKIGRD